MRSRGCRRNVTRATDSLKCKGLEMMGGKGEEGVYLAGLNNSLKKSEQMF